MQFSNPRHYQQSSMLFGKQGNVNYTDDDWVDKMLEVVFNAFRQLGGCKPTTKSLPPSMESLSLQCLSAIRGM